MAHGYEDAEITIPVTELSKWMVDVSAKNKDTGASLDNSTILPGDVIVVESKMKDLSGPGEVDSIWVDGRLIPKVNGSHDKTKYKHVDYAGKTLEFYTNDLTAGRHELRLKRSGHPDAVFVFTVSAATKAAAPVFTLDREQLMDGTTTYEGGVLREKDIVLRSQAEVDDWFGNIQKVFWIDSTGTQKEITADYQRTIDDSKKTVTIVNKTFTTLNTTGSYTLLLKSRGYEDVSLPVQIVKAMPANTVLTYEQDGSVTFSSSTSAYVAKDYMKTVTINGTPYAAAAFEFTSSYPKYTMTIPSEYLDADTKTVIKIAADGYSDFIKTVDIPASHVKRKASPAVTLSEGRVAKGGNVDLTFTDDSIWRSSITSAMFRAEGATSTTSMTVSDKTTAGRLTIKTPSYTTGKGSMIIKSTGYRDLVLPLELVEAVPGTVTPELQSTGSVAVAVSNSTYLSKISVTVDGVSTTEVEKSTNLLTIKNAAFPTKKTYQVVLKADGYADYTFSVNTDVQTPPVLTAPGKPLQKQEFLVNVSDSVWASKITSAALTDSYSTITYAKADITAEASGIRFAAKTNAYSGTYTLRVYADGYTVATMPITFVTAVPGTISLEATASAVLLNVSDYSYRNAIQTIQVGETSLTKGTDFSTSSNPISISQDKFPQAAANIVITATGYSDYSTSFDLGAIQSAPEVTLPQEIAASTSLVLTSGDSSWANAVSEIEIGSFSSLTTIAKADLTVQDGVITVPASKLSYISTGTAKVIKIYANGYYTKQFDNVTIYSKSSAAYDRTTEWSNGNLRINLAETGVSYSYYNVGQVYVNGVLVTPTTKPNLSATWLVIPASAFNGLTGLVNVKITNTSSSYPDLNLTATVPSP